MKLSENVEIETNEFKASNSRASRLARYSTAAAGVAAVSTLDVDAAMIKVIVTDSGAVGTSSYTLDLSAIAPGASFRINLFSSSSSSYQSLSVRNFNNTSIATTDGSTLRVYKTKETINASDFLSIPEGAWTNTLDPILGFRVNQGGSNYTYGWLKTTFGSSSSFTLNSYGYNDTLNEAAIAGQGSSAVPDSGPGVVGLALLGAGAAGMRLLRKLRAGK